MAFPEVVGNLEQEMVIKRELAEGVRRRAKAGRRSPVATVGQRAASQQPPLRTSPTREETSEAETCYWRNCYCYLIINIIIEL